MIRRAPLIAAVGAWLLALPATAALPYRLDFTVEAAGEVVASVEVRCEACDWGRVGREAASLRLELDGRYSQHLLVPGAERSASRLLLGPVAAGPHRLEIRLDEATSAPGVGAVDVAAAGVEVVSPGDPNHTLIAHAPLLYARPDSVGRFSDAPLLAWAERDALPDGAERLRYSVVFSNEDGGTPPDRLLATWGRLTDIEFVYGVELDSRGGFRRSDYQAEGHAIEPFAGTREGQHPLLFVVTDNNMLADAGDAPIRFAPVPMPFDLSDVSREAVMDAEPWTYRLSSQEARREGRVAEDARRGEGQIVDPRRYLYLEACAETRDVGLSFGAVLETPTGLRELESDGGLGRYLVLRSPDHFPNGCFRAAVALPEGSRLEEVRALRFRARTRPPREDEAPLPPGTGSARLRRVSELFMLGPDDLPGPSAFSWEGDLALSPLDGPAELAVRP